MRIQQIRVEKLFGLFSYTIDLNMKEHITILHGPNGFGKTTLLKMLNSLFNNYGLACHKVPFENLNIVLEDKTTIIINREMISSNDTVLKIEYEGLTHKLSSLPESNHIHFALHSIERDIPDLYRTGPDTWQYLPTQETYTFEDIVDLFGESLPSLRFYLEQIRPNWLKKLQQNISVRFIDVQRLQRHPRTRKKGIQGNTFVPTVGIYSAELVETIQLELAKYASLSHTLDRSFPARLLTPSSEPKMDRQQIQKQFEKLEHLRSRFVKAGILNEEEEIGITLPTELNEHLLHVLSIYLRDIQKKMSALEEFAKKIELFKSILNGLFSHKKIQISNTQGFELRGSNGILLSPAQLSSGEQHQLVLMYELLFKTSSNSLILIDEPELSLHVLWQEEFLQHLQKITNLIHCDVMIATHSPEIINDRWDLTVGLEGDVS